MPARATVIIPTFGDASFLRWAIASAQLQTVRELEIRVVCDGSPLHMREQIQAMAAEDPRIAVSVTTSCGTRSGLPR
jgi:glycosyltransferase involved in cell wall biosynthesis